MEHNISITELISLELYLGSISFIIGTLFFIMILQKLRLKKNKNIVICYFANYIFYNNNIYYSYYLESTL
ncbi:hypothetical protein DW182_20265 [Bacteroides sp. AM16-24]|jgi:hypothetical protein|uniref:Uncharacterized protein n=1 Tax=Bacteroides intestinalis TaxID=329854 RepID=A0A6N2WQ37_9BACE|nr:hypothetical protein DW182_20265 [Bacteroides sp. AM16-24]